MNTYLAPFMRYSGLPSRTTVWTTSSELLGFVFSFPYNFHFCAVRQIKLAILKLLKYIF